MSDAFVELRAANVPIGRACALIGRARLIIATCWARCTVRDWREWSPTTARR